MNNNESIDDAELLDDIDSGEELESSDAIITIPTTIKNTTSKNTKKNSAAGPILGALGVAAAAGIGTKIYMDNKANNTNNEEEYDGSENNEINADNQNRDEIKATTGNDECYLMYDKNRRNLRFLKGEK